MSSERKVAVITGASQGIGAGLVAGFRGAGYAIIGLPPAVPQPAMIERHEVVDLLHIVRLEPLATSPVAGDGQEPE